MNAESDEISVGEGIICEFKLLNEKEEPLFKAKKYTNNEYIDIAVLPINVTYNSNGKILKPLCINSAYYEKFKSKDVIHPSDNVFILGYPLGKKMIQVLLSGKEAVLRQHYLIEISFTLIPVRVQECQVLQYFI